jgi:hypothetical protein
MQVSSSEKRKGITRQMEVLPMHVIAFGTEPGVGCEQANFGLCQYACEVSHAEVGKRRCARRGRISIFARLGYLPLLHILVEERAGERRFTTFQVACHVLRGSPLPASAGRRDANRMLARQLPKIEMRPRGGPGFVAQAKQRQS